MNNENFDLVTNDENEEFTVELGEVINDGGTHDYNELDNQPQINGHTLEGNKTGEQLDLQDKINDLDTIRSGATKGATAVQPEDLARIATTGSYNDSLDKPSVNNVALIGNISLDALGIQPKGNYALESEIPDVSNFITNTVDNLVNYYKKSETFTKQEVNDLISAITTMDIQVVQTLPTEDISTTTIYLVPKTTAGTNDAYDEYIYVSNAWEHIGSTDIDLSGYQTKIDSSHKLSSDLVDDANQTNKFVTTSEKQTWNNKLDESDLSDYVKNTDYATSSKAGVIRCYNSDGITTNTNNGALITSVKTYAQYNSSGNWMFVGKGTLENVIAGKGLVTNQDISGKANKISVVQTSASTIEINPNTFYKFGEVASLNITLASITDNTIYNEYMFEFISGATATTLTLPSSVKWLETPTIEANKIYQCSIVDNVGVLLGVSNV